MKKFYIKLAVTLVAMVLLAVAIVVGTPKKETPTCEVVYTSYLVQPGDNLWTISEKFNKVGISTRGYVNLLREINEISADYLRAGTSIVIVLPAEKNILPTTN